MTKTIIILVIIGVLVAGTLISSTPAFARNIGPIGEFHIEIPPSSDAFDFEGVSYVVPVDLSADVSLGQETIIGYRTMLGLNGAQIANLGIVDFISTTCSDFNTASFSNTISTTLPGDVVPTSLTVYLVETGQETKVKLQLQEFGIDFTAPNGLKFDYEILECVPSNPSPIITSLVIDDPDDLDKIYSNGDTITITFDSDTNTPGGAGVQTRVSVNNMFAFTESLGQVYRGQWNSPNTFIITINSVNNAAPPIINDTTVIPSGTTPILSADETSSPSSVISPVLSGDFGVPPPPCGVEKIQKIDWNPLDIPILDLPQLEGYIITEVDFVDVFNSNVNVFAVIISYTSICG